MKNKKASGKTDVILTVQQVTDAEARDHGGYGPVRRSLLLMLTQSVDEIAQGAIKNPQLAEELLQVAEHAVKYFEWLKEDERMLKGGWARLASERAANLRQRDRRTLRSRRVEP